MDKFDSAEKVVNSKISKSEEVLNKKNERSSDSIEQKHTGNFNYFKNELVFHQDVIDLLWISDGKKKIIDFEKVHSITNDYFKIFNQDVAYSEPSRIMTKSKIKKPNDPELVGPPDRSPSYSSLTPEQKWMYLNFLQDPYTQYVNVTYVFLFYYGLERHLFEGDFDKAFQIIIKLRDIYNNRPFHGYSARAIAYSCLYHNKREMLIEFISPTDEFYDHLHINSLVLVLYNYELDLPAANIMKAAKDFGFSNNNYISKYPKLFLDTLKKVVCQKYNKESIDVHSFFDSHKISRLSYYDAPIYANKSLSNFTVKDYDFVKDPEFCKEIFDLLACTHNQIKNELARMRKEGIAMPVEEPNCNANNQRSQLFDIKKEQYLLNKESKLLNKPLKLHDLYQEIHDFYYKYYECDKVYRDKCIEYCYKDINNYESYVIAVNEHKLLDLKKNYKAKRISENEYANCLKMVEQGLPIYFYAYTRLAIIFEKNKEYEKAIEICNEAISLGIESYRRISYVDRKEELIKKLNKEGGL